MESNPVQIRIDALTEEWNRVREGEDVRIVRILHKPDEENMIDAFCTYLLSEDAPNLDIPFLFESTVDGIAEAAPRLLMELYGLIEIWNKAALPDGSHNDQIDWKPLPLIASQGSGAVRFIHEFNRLADLLDLDEDAYLVAVLPVDMLPPDTMVQWLEDAIHAGIGPKVRLLVMDSTERRVFDRLAARHPKTVRVLVPDLNLPAMMQQIAAMGDPMDPKVQYRRSLVALTEAVKARDAKAVSRLAEECLFIARRQAEADPLWHGQVLVVFSLLCHDQIGEKAWKRAIGFATEGVDAMRAAAPAMPDPYFGRKFIAQAVMTRASVHAADGDWHLAAVDFREAADLYALTHDKVLCIEAFRMLGQALIKSNRKGDAGGALAEGFRHAAALPPAVLRDTTFPGLVQLLLECPHGRHLPAEELEEYMRISYGKDWRRWIARWPEPPAEKKKSPAPPTPQTA
jgi:hypothetical protein